jgi:hypothetical protein
MGFVFALGALPLGCDEAVGLRWSEVSAMQSQAARALDDHSTITEAPVVDTILEHLGVRASPRPRAPGRDRDWEQVGVEGFDAA